MILWNFLVKKEDNLVGKIFTFTLLYGSLYSAYIWTGECSPVWAHLMGCLCLDPD